MAGLRLENVNFSYTSNTNTILEKFVFDELRIDVGEIVTVVGKSGSGKSTLIKLIAGFLKASNREATIEWKSKAISQPLSPVKVVFQEYSNTIFDLLTVQKNIWIGEKCQSTYVAFEYEAVVETLGLKGLEGRLASDLSGGQKQRVQLGRILMTQPELIILDEPDSSLDIETKNTLLNFIINSQLEQKYKLTWILITHDLDIAAWISSKIIVIDRNNGATNITNMKGFNRELPIKKARESRGFNELVNSIKDKLNITF